MAILITGTGTVGMQVVRSSVEKKEEDVIVIDISPDKQFLESVAGKDFILERGSITNLPFLLEIISKYDVKRIIHTAVAPEENPSIYETINTNVIGTSNIFEAARILDVKRVVNCSSAGVYDFTKERPTGPVAEEWPISPKDDIPYYSSKIAVEAIARNYSYKYGVKIITTRLAGNFGQSVRYNMGDKLWIYNLLKDAAINGSINFDTVQTRDLPWTYAKDTADCLVHIAYSTLDPKIPVYNCAYHSLNGLNEMLGALHELIPDLNININKTEELGWKFPYDVSRIQNDFDYQFDYGMKEAFADYIKWIRNNPQYNQ